MDVFEALKHRRSVRVYKNEKIDKRRLMQILDAVRIAPSWKNYQCCSCIVLSERDIIMKLGEAVKFNPSKNAYENSSHFLVFCADPQKSGERDGKTYYMADAAISVQNAVLAAEALGLGTCWIGAFTEQPVKQLLGIPEPIRVVALTPLGVPAEHPDERPRKPLAEIAYSNGWGMPIDL